MKCKQVIQLLQELGEDDLEVFIQVSTWEDEEIEDGEVLEITDKRSIQRHLDGIFILADQVEP
jgi:hypothetical protein